MVYIKQIKILFYNRLAKLRKRCNVSLIWCLKIVIIHLKLLKFRTHLLKPQFLFDKIKIKFTNNFNPFLQSETKHFLICCTFLFFTQNIQCSSYSSNFRKSGKCTLYKILSFFFKEPTILIIKYLSLKI